MLKKLKYELDKYGITNKSLVDGSNLDLPYSEATICKKIKGSNKKEFIKDDKKEIFNLLVSRGYEGTFEELFVSTDPNAEDIPKNGWMADIINKRIYSLNLEGKMIEEFRKEGIELPEATLSDWRSGKTKNIRNPIYLNALCKILNVDIRYMLGDRRFANNGNSEDVANERRNLLQFYDDLFKIFIRMLKYDDPVYKENADLLDKLFEDVDFQKLFINEIIHDNYPRVKKYIENWISGFGDEWIIKDINKEIIQKTDIKKTKWYLLNKRIPRKKAATEFTMINSILYSKATTDKIKPRPDAEIKEFYMNEFNEINEKSKETSRKTDEKDKTKGD